ncbi:MAG: response regulator [Spirochaetaceae bacterium]|nr:MAG: response regulator [Spirochaetaceae bacterium]
MNNSILLVEDDPITLIVTKKELEAYGYSIISSPNGEDAVQKIKNENSIELILMDIDLGAGMDGTEAAQEILTFRNIPIVFLSSHTEREIVEKTEKISSYGYVVKNSGVTVLDASIKMAFKLFSAKRNLENQEKNTMY